MASAVFFISNWFNEINVGHCPDKLAKRVRDGVVCLMIWSG